MVVQWIQDGCPKAVFTVSPSGTSLEENKARNNANRLTMHIKALVPEVPDGVGGMRPVGVFNAVGTMNTSTVEAAHPPPPRLAASRSFARAFTNPFFNEGTDWPFCSHVYCDNTTSSVQLALQRLGRSLRDKSEIKGYPEEFKDVAMISLFLPPVKDDIRQLERPIHRYAFLLAAYLGDPVRADWFSSDALKPRYRIRPNDIGRGRSGSAGSKTNESMLPNEVSNVRQAVAEFVAVYREEHDGDNPLIPQVHHHLQSRDDLTPVEKQYSKYYLVRRVEHETSLDLNTIQSDDLDTVFAQVVDEYADHTISMDDYFVSVVSDVSGRDIKDVVQRLAAWGGKPRAEVFRHLVENFGETLAALREAYPAVTDWPGPARRKLVPNKFGARVFVDDLVQHLNRMGMSMPRMIRQIDNTKRTA